MKWKDVFCHPDQVGESAYRAIHECAASAIRETDEPDPDSELSSDDMASIKAILDTFRDWADTLMKKCERVVVCVRGGVVEVQDRPDNVTVEIRDYDTQNCDQRKREDDGALVSVYGREDE